jgi:hypothetical protein
MSKFCSCITMLLAVAGVQASTIDYTTSATGIFSGTAVTQYDALLGLTTSPGPQGAMITRTFTPNPSPLGATSSSASTIGSWIVESLTLTASASAAANLANGTLQASSSGSLNPRPNLPPDGGDGLALAAMQDVLTFENSTNQTQQVLASFAFTGSVGGTSPTPFTLMNQFCMAPGEVCLSTSNPSLGYGLLTGPDNLINVGGQAVVYEVPYSFQLGTELAAPGVSLPAYLLPVSTFIPGANPYSGTYQLTLTLNPGPNVYSLFAEMEAFCAMTTCTSSGAVSFAPLPDGVTFTSSSGSFLSGPAPANPVTNVSNQVRVTETGFVVNHITKLWTSTVTVTNIGSTTIAGPVQLVLNGLTPGANGISMTNSSGLQNGFYYITVSPGSIAPGASASVYVQFMNPNNAWINFTPETDSGAF